MGETAILIGGKGVTRKSAIILLVLSLVLVIPAWSGSSIGAINLSAAYSWFGSRPLGNALAACSLLGVVAAVWYAIARRRNPADAETPRAPISVLAYGVLVSVFCVFGMMLGIGFARMTDAPLFGSPAVAAEANGPAMVWVDPKTHVYYCGGAKRYGKTKNGKHTTLAEAQRQGYRPADGNPCPRGQTVPRLAKLFHVYK